MVDGLETSLDHAIQSRGGVHEVRRRSTGHPRNLAIECRLTLPGFRTATYGFEVGARERSYTVKRERLVVRAAGGQRLAHFNVVNGVTDASAPILPPASQDHLLLVTASGLPEYREVYNTLRAMGFYNLSPDAMRELQNPDARELLRRDGSNVASIVGRIAASRDAARLQRIGEYLERIVPGVKEAGRKQLGPKETLEFRQSVQGADNPWTFYAASMSDGTLRAFGALVAVMQFAGAGSGAVLVAIEEPETALHPAATGALVDAIREAAQSTQVLLTTHSPEILDFISTEEGDRVIVVQSRGGTTEAAPPDAASRRMIREHLFTAGELLRKDQLTPEPSDSGCPQQLELFADDETDAQ